MNKNLFNTIALNNPQSNYFDLSHDLKFTMKMGMLIPTTVVDCVPGDNFKIGFENMLRFTTLLAPIMHRVKVTTHYFFVPNRIIWDNWENWITGNLDVEPPYFFPTVRTFAELPANPLQSGVRKGSPADYMGVPVYADPTPGHQPKISALPFAAYAKIWKEFYMDQNNTTQALQDRMTVMSELVDGYNGDRSAIGDPDEWAIFGLKFTENQCLPRAWSHDYFTSALPYAQKGDQVFMPIGDFNDVSIYTDPSVMPAPQNTGGRIKKTDGTFITSSGNIETSSTGIFRTAISGNPPSYYDPNGSMFADMSELQAGAASINNLRRAFRLQEWLEKNARGGTRYAESILSHFGVRSRDSRLQRPEYLGGSVQNMVISEVLSTAQTLTDTNTVANPVGQMSGHGISVGGSKVLNYYCEEHGHIIGLLSVMPDTAYSQGIHKKFSRFDRLEYYWPTFANIGEQPITNQEIFWDSQSTSQESADTFGYVPRYAEYKYENNRIAGDFRETLNFWHLGREFASTPALNEEFIYPDPTTFDRIFAVADQDQIYAHVLNKIKAQRKMPKYGTPTL